MRAQQSGWDIRLAAPWTGLRNAWHNAFGHFYGNPGALVYQFELIAILAGLAGTAALLARRRWAEAVYCGLLFGSLACTTHPEGVPRAMLVAFPVYGLLARAAHRQPAAGRAYLAVALPLWAVTALLYLTGNYAG